MYQENVQEKNPGGDEQDQEKQEESSVGPSPNQKLGKKNEEALDLEPLVAESEAKQDAEDSGLKGGTNLESNAMADKLVASPVALPLQ